MPAVANGGGRKIIRIANYEGSGTDKKRKSREAERPIETSRKSREEKSGRGTKGSPQER
jgi:hypothetical protein